MIDGETLRAMQAPLKDRYRDEPDAAVVTLRATGSIGLDDVTCSVETSKAMIRAGLHPATGGDGLAACSGDMLLEALVACAGVTLNAVASAPSRMAQSPPKAISTSAARSGSTATRQWDSGPFALASPSIRMPMTTPSIA